MSGDSGNNPRQNRQQNGEPSQPQQGRQQEQSPQGQQPQSQEQGQPPQGQAPRQPARQGGQSGPNPLQEWTVYGTALFALAGAGLGLFLLLADAVDEPILAPDGPAASQVGFGSAFAEMFILVAAMVAIFGAAFVGVGFSRRLSLEEGTSLQIAGAVGALGTLAVLVLVTIFNFLTVDNVSLEVAGLLINGIIAGLVGGLAGAGGFWIDRNQSPTVA
jgi:hypothetical protein